MRPTIVCASLADEIDVPIAAMVSTNSASLSRNSVPAIVDVAVRYSLPVPRARGD